MTGAWRTQEILVVFAIRLSIWQERKWSSHVKSDENQKYITGAMAVKFCLYSLKAQCWPLWFPAMIVCRVLDKRTNMGFFSFTYRVEKEGSISCQCSFLTIILMRSWCKFSSFWVLMRKNTVTLLAVWVKFVSCMYFFRTGMLWTTFVLNNS